MTTQSDIISELLTHKYPAKIDGALVTLDLNPPPGHSRSYTIEKEGAGDTWCVTLTEVSYDESGEDNEEQTIIGSYASAAEIAEAIEEEENG